MIKSPSKRCEEKKCRELAIYGTETTRLRCETHKHDDDINLVEKECQSCHLPNILNKNNFCSNCEPSIYAKVTKRKEKHIADLLTLNGFIFTNDRVPNGTNCGRERPDFVFDQGTHIIILEVDEDQHKGYQCLCEQTRMVNITQSFGGIPVFWIRYNPDDFKLPNKSKSNISQNTRESYLLRWIKYAMTRQSKNLLEVIYLFYNGCTENVGEEDITTIKQL